MNRSKKDKIVNNKKRNKSVRPLLTLTEVCPPQISVPLSYSTRMPFNGAVSVSNQFNINSLFDPDRTGVGHQPLGFDQWCGAAAFYNRYRVDRADIQVDLANNATTAFDYVINATNDPTLVNTVATFDSAVEAPFSKSGVLGVITGGDAVKCIRASYDLSKITGVTKAKYKNDDVYSATSGVSPSEVLIMNVVVQDPGFAVNVQCFVKVKIKYHCTFWDRNQLIQS